MKHIAMGDDMLINLKIMRKGAVLPEYGSRGAAGADLRACVPKPVEIAPHSTEKIPTGIAVSLPEGYFGAIYARSGLSTREGLRPANAVGVIDCDYTGELVVALHNDSETAKIVEPQQRIAQLVVQPYVSAQWNVVEKLDATERAGGGFGSTGRR